MSINAIVADIAPRHRCYGCWGNQMPLLRLLGQDASDTGICKYVVNLTRDQTACAG